VRVLSCIARDEHLSQDVGLNVMLPAPFQVSSMLQS